MSLAHVFYDGRLAAYIYVDERAMKRKNPTAVGEEVLHVQLLAEQPTSH